MYFSRENTDVTVANAFLTDGSVILTSTVTTVAMKAQRTVVRF